MLLLPTGCFVCTCPYSKKKTIRYSARNFTVLTSVAESPARGCLGPAEMSPKRVETLLNGTKTCDSGAKAQVVDRYIRVVS